VQFVSLIESMFKSWFVLIEFCAKSPINDPACTSLWVYVAMASGVAGVLLLTWAILKLIRYYTEAAAEEERAFRAAAAADDDAVKNSRRGGRDQFPEDGDNFEKRVRQLLAERNLIK
jgi:hypothetical protein